MAKKTSKPSKEVINEEVGTKVEEKEVKIPEKTTKKKNQTEETAKVVEKQEEAKKDELTEEQKKAKEEEEAKAKEEEENEKKKKIDSLHKAGDIHKKVMEFIKPMIKPGASVLEICEKAEEKIAELGGLVGFPANIAINEVAAHYTSPLGDETLIKDEDVVKVDIGVAVEGWVADGAATINFNKSDKCKNLPLAVETAVKAGLMLIKPGVSVRDIGKKTEEVIRQFGYYPISDLTGHKIEQYELHGGKIIPNTKNGPAMKFEVGEVYGFEVFASTGLGSVRSSSNTYIFSIVRSAVPKIRNKIGRKILDYVAEKYLTLPFSERDVLKQFPIGRFGLKELVDNGILHRHPVIREEGAFIAQYENTIMITEDGYELIC